LILLGFLLAFMSNFLKFFSQLLPRLFGSAPSPEADAFIATAHEEMLAQHSQHASSWQFGKEKGWSADLEAGIIVFQFAGDRTGTSHFQTIGVYDEASECFIWGWSQTTLPATIRQHADLAKLWGQTQRQALFKAPSIKCSMDDAWKLAAATRKIAGAHSVYRGRIGNRYIFMTTEEIHINDRNSPTTPAASIKHKPDWTKGRHRSTW
jgi:hypothetical protein